MGYKDLHDKPFDKKTIAKLEIFEDYAKAWIPTFVMAKATDIHIFDLFSGPGYDNNGIPGSPIRILEKVEYFKDIIRKNHTKVFLYFNEFEPGNTTQEKYNKLKTNCESFLSQNRHLKEFIAIKFFNDDAKQLFFKLESAMSNNPSLVFLDQNGVKFLSSEYLTVLAKMHKTDFMFFAASSYFYRLRKTDEFKKVLDLNENSIDKKDYKNIHRIVVNKLKENARHIPNLHLYPFSIKKGTHIYGVIFGATHYRAVDKFLTISWNKNKTNGEADFDIDGDKTKGYPDLFGEIKLTKIQKFKEDLETKIKNGYIRNNKEALIYTYMTGNFYRHANDLLKALKKKGIVHYEGSTPAISYDNVFKNDKKVIYFLNN